MADLEGQDGQLEISEPGMPGARETLLPDVDDFRAKFRKKVGADLNDVDLGGHA